MTYKFGDKLFRIQRLIYNKRGFISEQEAKIDDPKKADLVSTNVDDFFKTLEGAANSGGLSQQRRGEMQYQKAVESMQIGLTLLGYELRRHGIDGLFGPETAAAVEKFKMDNMKNLDTISEAMTKLKMTSLPNVKYDFDGTHNDYVNKSLLDDINKAAKAAGVVATITTAKTGHAHQTKSGHKSRHVDGTGVDIAIIDGIDAGGASNSSNGNPKFRELGNRLASALESMGYERTESGNKKAVLWQTNTGGNHFNHLHVSSTSGASSLSSDAQVGSSYSSTVASPEMLNIMIEKLKVRGINPEELKKLIDTKVRSSLSLTGDWVNITKQLLKRYEGFISNAKWDENAFRGGYGTDKKLVNGRLVDATKQTTWTREEAENTMEYEIQNRYAPIVARQLGKENWEKLNDMQKAALVSHGYNVGPYFIGAKDYGRNIKKAIENGDMELAADYIGKGPTTGSRSGKVYSSLQKRRKEEAQLFLS